MFKASSYLPQWFRKPSSVSKSTTSSEDAETPKSFTLPALENKNQLVNISMINNKEDESFVDIEYRQLTYAEVALLAKEKKAQAQAEAQLNGGSNKIGGPMMKKRQTDRLNSNQYNILMNDDETDDKPEVNDAYESYKSDTSYQKSKQYKHKQFDSVQKRKLKKSERKASLKQSSS
ncbi:hypothetical protein DFJ63DRAFT_312348 [Scheffersomyces coipomensis]|uniref:uncharacterized protein n=1 Tax=Scheffersomyces coipomensis TaxID=1788519 RepID=UPI00315DA342